jgi:hypothetical protein
MTRHTHADQLSLLPPNFDVRVAYLCDRVVAARVDATLVSPGALNPVAAHILDVINTSREIPLDLLTEPFGDTPEIKAMIAEVVYALARAERISVDEIDAGVLIKDRPSTNRLECTVDYVSHTVQFLPAAEFIARRLPASTSPPEDRKPIFEHVWAQLYNAEALKKQVAQVYAQNFYVFKGQSDIEESNEVLRRARLQRGQAYPRSVSVTIEPMRELYTLHRCFLYRGDHDADEWSVVVRPLNSVRNIRPYTKLLHDQIRDRAFLGRLIDESDLIVR